MSYQCVECGIIVPSKFQLDNHIQEFHTKLQKGEMFSLLGEKCVRCGFSDKRALQFDHINGGGSKEDESGLTGQKQLNYYVKNPEIAKKTLQVLCSNCNWIKRHEQNEEMRPFKHFPQHLER